MFPYMQPFSADDLPNGATARLVPARLEGGVLQLAGEEMFGGRMALEVVLVRAGSVTYELTGRTTRVTAGTLAVYWGGMPHMRTGACAEILSVTVPLGRLLMFDLGRGLLHRVLRGEVLTAHGEAWLRPMEQWIADLADGDAFVRRTVEIELQARLLRLGLAYDPERTINAQSAPDALYDMMAFLYENFQEDITALDVAAEVGLPPARAQILFRRYFGTGTMDFLQRLRLWHAQARLVASRDTVLRIALEAGFGSLPRFYAAFKDAFGVAPGIYRRHVQREQKPPELTPNNIVHLPLRHAC